MLSVIPQTFSKAFVHIHYVSVHSNLIVAFFLCQHVYSFPFEDINDLWLVIYFRSMTSSTVFMRKI